MQQKRPNTQLYAFLQKLRPPYPVVSQLDTTDSVMVLWSQKAKKEHSDSKQNITINWQKKDRRML